MEVINKKKKVKGLITILRALPYKGNMIYVRRIQSDIFEWLLIYDNQLYSSYLIMRPKNGCEKLTQKEEETVTEIVWAGALATIDTLMDKKLSKKDEKIVRAFEEGRMVN
jgi:hypothetical protein